MASCSSKIYNAIQRRRVSTENQVIQSESTYNAGTYAYVYVYIYICQTKKKKTLTEQLKSVLLIILFLFSFDI